MDKPIYLGFVVLEWGKLQKYEAYYDKLQSKFGQESLQLHYVDTDVFNFSMNTKDIIKDLKNSADIFDFSNSDKDHELFSIRKKSNW